MHFDLIVSNELFDCLGYRMAVECARNALLQKVMDNKDDEGMLFVLYSLLHHLFFPSWFSWLCEVQHFPPYCSVNILFSL